MSGGRHSRRPPRVEWAASRRGTPKGDWPVLAAMSIVSKRSVTYDSRSIRPMVCRLIGIRVEYGR